MQPLMLMGRPGVSAAATPPNYKTSSYNSGNLGVVTSITVNRPGAVSTGELIIVVLESTGTGAKVVTAPDGTWTQQQYSENSASPGGHLGIWTKTAGGSEPSTYTFTSDVSSRWGFQSFAVQAASGVDGSNIANSNGSTNVVASSLTTTHANCLLIYIAVVDGQNADNWGGPSGFTRIGVEDNSGVNGAVGYCSRNTQAAAGASGTKTGTTVPDANSFGFASLIAFYP